MLLASYNAIHTAFSNLLHNNSNSIVTRYRYTTNDNRFNNYYVADINFHNRLHTNSYSERFIDWLKVFIASLYVRTEFVLNFSIIQLDNILYYSLIIDQDISNKIIRLKTVLEFIRMLLQSVHESFEISFYRGLLHLFLYFILGIFMFYGNENSILFILKFRDLYNHFNEG